MNPDDVIQNEEEFKKSLQKEVEVMREVLANLLQEELFLFHRDASSLEKVAKDRFSMMESLETVRKKRPVDLREDACEIDLLFEQIAALTNKINLQHSRNKLLLDSPFSRTTYAMPLRKKSKKTALMTIPETYRV